jgi:hypothetical protein
MSELSEIRQQVNDWGKQGGHDGMYLEDEVLPFAILERLDRIINLLEALTVR